MGKCGRRVKKIGLAIVQAVSPVGVRLIGDFVKILSGTNFENSEKRELAVELAKAALKQRGIEARGSAIRTVVEVSVDALEQGEEALNELGAADEPEIGEEPDAGPDPDVSGHPV